MLMVLLDSGELFSILLDCYPLICYGLCVRNPVGSLLFAPTLSNASIPEWSSFMVSRRRNEKKLNN